MGNARTFESIKTKKIYFLKCKELLILQIGKRIWPLKFGCTLSIHFKLQTKGKIDLFCEKKGKKCTTQAKFHINLGISKHPIIHTFVKHFKRVVALLEN